MIRAILFDLGGTLDGAGLHWLDRFLNLYQSYGVERTRESIRAAFDQAERLSVSDEAIASSNLAGMIELHVRWQLAHLGIESRPLEQHLIEGFIAPMRQATAQSARLLAVLAKRGFELGVVSNGCGNVAVLCAEFGFTPFLSTIVDSRRVGLFKPDPAIFSYAAKAMNGDPSEMLMVGDSFDRDVVPARKVGMKTAWLTSTRETRCPDPSLVDLRLERLSDLAAAVGTPPLSPA